jgi:hypothetical protein
LDAAPDVPQICPSLGAMARPQLVAASPSSVSD